MFQFCTFLGATIVPLSYLIVWDLTKSLQAASFSALFILFGTHTLLSIGTYLDEQMIQFQLSTPFFRCGNADIKSVHLVRSNIIMFHDVRNLGNGSYEHPPQQTIYMAMVGLVIVHRNFPRVHNECKICWPVCCPAGWTLHSHGIVERIRRSYKTHCKLIDNFKNLLTFKDIYFITDTRGKTLTCAMRLSYCLTNTTIHVILLHSSFCFK